MLNIVNLVRFLVLEYVVSSLKMFFFFLDKKETKKPSHYFLVGRTSFQSLKEKNQLRSNSFSFYAFFKHSTLDCESKEMLTIVNLVRFLVLEYIISFFKMFFFFLDKKETKKPSQYFLVGRTSFQSLKEKNSPPRRIKQLFFLRFFQTFDARMRK